MLKFKKIVFGLAIMTGLIVLSLYYLNSYNKKVGVEKAYTQKKITSAPVKEAVNLNKDENLSAADTTSIEDSTVYKAAALDLSLTKEEQSQIDELINQYYEITNKFNSEIFATTSKKDTKELFQKKKEIIESYKNIENIIKPGVTKDTYFVFTVYDIKFKNIKTLVPGMSVLSIIKDDNGKLLINNASSNKNTDQYIKQLTEDNDVKSVIEGVNKRLTAALKKDASLKKFVKYIKEIS